MHSIKIKTSTMAGEIFDIIQIKEVQVKLYKTATIVWAALKSPTMETIASGKIELTADEYNDWGHGDDHIVEIICSRMNVELI
jgi:hypothetical protein